MDTGGLIFMIYTSYFGKLKTLPNNIIPISICAKAPDGYNGLQYKKLAPTYDIFTEWKRNHNNDQYIEQYKSRVLYTLDFWKIYDELCTLAESQCDGKAYEICLICYEKPSDFCHRHLVSDWFNQNGVLCEEWSVL